LACDFLIAAESTKLGDTHGQWGLVPIWGMTRRLPERVGRSTAKELMFTSRRITGTEAEGIKLVDHAVPDDALDGFVDTFAAEICENSWDTNRFVKQLIAGGDERSRTEALIWEREMPFGSPRDMKERMNRGR
jgi:enoyl-CoA hydratase/carnithine racemase